MENVKRKVMKERFALLILVIASLIAVQCGGSPSETETPATKETPATLDGKSLLQERCTKCHDLGRVERAKETEEEWKATVERMVGKGAQFNQAEELALAAPDVDPPANLKRRLMAQVQPSCATAPAEPRASWWQTLANLMQRATPVWRLASLILVVALAVSNLLLWQRLNQPVLPPQPGGLHIVMLTGT